MSGEEKKSRSKTPVRKARPKVKKAPAASKAPKSKSAAPVIRKKSVEETSDRVADMDLFGDGPAVLDLTSAPLPAASPSLASAESVESYDALALFGPPTPPSLSPAASSIRSSGSGEWDTVKVKKSPTEPVESEEWETVKKKKKAPKPETKEPTKLYMKKSGLKKDKSTSKERKIDSESSERKSAKLSTSSASTTKARTTTTSKSAPRPPRPGDDTGARKEKKKTVKLSRGEEKTELKDSKEEKRSDSKSKTKSSSTKSKPERKVKEEIPLPLQIDLGLELLQKIKDLENSDCGDLIFEVGLKKERFFSSQSILAVQSDMLSKKLQAIEKRDEQNRLIVHLPDYNVDAFKSVLGYLHSGVFQVKTRTEEMLESLLKICDDFGLRTLSNEIVDALNDEVKDETCIQLLKFALKYNQNELEKLSSKYIDKHAEFLFSQEEFLRAIDKAMFKKLLSSKNLAIQESTLFAAIQRWVRIKTSIGEEKVEEKELLDELVAFVQFEFFPADQLLEDKTILKVLSEERIIDILATKADPRAFSKLPKRPKAIIRKVKEPSTNPILRSNLVTRTFESLIASSGLRRNPRTQYQWTHDGGACILEEMIFAHYGQEATEGNRLHMIPAPVEDEEKESSLDYRIVELPFPTHGSYPEADRERGFVYVFEDTDGTQNTGFGWVSRETGEFERLPNMPDVHFRYSRGCVQQGRFFKAVGFSSPWPIHAYNPDEQSWSRVSGFDVDDGVCLLANPQDDNSIWVKFQGSRLQEYKIAENQWIMKADCPHHFELGANYPCFIIPGAQVGDTSHVFVAVYTSSTWTLYNSETNTWTDLPSWPMISEGGHCFYDLDTGRIFFQADGDSTFQYYPCPEEP